jgi:hypothetical protein
MAERLPERIELSGPADVFADGDWRTLADIITSFTSSMVSTSRRPPPRSDKRRDGKRRVDLILPPAEKLRTVQELEPETGNALCGAAICSWLQAFGTG